MSRSAIAILSTENLQHNVRQLRTMAHPAKLIAMVKANAYGHGIRSVSLRLDGHLDMLGVASIDEAMALRKVGVRAPILLMEGVFEPEELLLASREAFHVVFHNDAQRTWLTQMETEKAQGDLLHAWLKVNTGMGRLGVEMADAAAYYADLCNHTQVAQPVRILSHFACADDRLHPLNQQQIDAFGQLMELLQGSEYSLCNSAAMIHFPECHYEYVRPGIALYGISPIQGISAESLGLKPVMTLKTSLIAVHDFQQGAAIGYGGRYRCPEPMRVGIIAFGYGDGYPFTAADGTPILVNQTECPLVGRVSMDMMAVDLRPCPHAALGDPVILWGEGLPIERVAMHTANIPWDMVTGVQHRVRFYWT